MAAGLASTRRFFADEIRAVAGLESEALVQALGRVPRERFFGPSPWFVTPGVSLGPTRYRQTDDPRELYHNHMVAIRPEKFLNNGVPSILAGLIDGLNLSQGKQVLHVGCGSGYFTALMADMVGRQGRVTAVEIEPDLALEAIANLKPWKQAQVVQGDGSVYEPEVVDAILVNASVTRPALPWLERLRLGGVLMLPMAVARNPQANDVMVMRLERTEAGFTAQTYSILTLYPCAGLRRAEEQALLNRAFESHALLRVRSLRQEQHGEEKSCVVHTEEYCLSELEAGSGSAG